jgi:uncharacterized LabA/DUF88 family protein
MSGTGKEDRALNEAATAALFIDLENIRYSLNHLGAEVEPVKLMDKARKYGKIAVAYAYADFSEHPEWLRRQLDVAGIQVRDVPLRRYQTNGSERVKSSADLHMLIDIMETAMDRPNVTTYLLMTGDADFIRVVTWLRNRYDKRVIVAGVPGSTSRDLIQAASEEDLVDAPPPPGPVDEAELVMRIVRMMHDRQPPLGFWTVKMLHQWTNDPRNGIPGTSSAHYDAIGAMLRDGLLRQTVVDTGDRTVTRTYLNEENEVVEEILEEIQASREAQPTI